jgi:hypothetical protein
VRIIGDRRGSPYCGRVSFLTAAISTSSLEYIRCCRELIKAAVSTLLWRLKDAAFGESRRYVTERRDEKHMRF